MENQVVKEVLQAIVDIDQTAEQKLASRDEYLSEQDMRIKHQVRQTELELMKDARRKVRTDYNQKMTQANTEKESILKSSHDYNARVMDYFKANKESLVDELCHHIFRSE